MPPSIWTARGGGRMRGQVEQPPQPETLQEDEELRAGMSRLLRKGFPTAGRWLAVAAVLLSSLVVLGARADAVETKTIICLGDSLTAGYGLTEDQAYPALIEGLAAHDHLSWRVINAGVSGDTTTGGLHRLAWILRAKPDLVLIALGGNDGLRGLPLDMTRDNLVRLVEQVQASGARVCVAGMLLPRNFGEDYRSQFAGIFPAVVKATHCPLMPFLLAGVGGNPSLNQADGIHPNVVGQQIVARNVYRFLLSQLEPAFATSVASTPAYAPAR